VDRITTELYNSFEGLTLRNWGKRRGKGLRNPIGRGEDFGGESGERGVRNDVGKRGEKNRILDWPWVYKKEKIRRGKYRTCIS